MDAFACRNGYGMSSDDRLARRAAQGDERAFAEIYSRYSQDLYRFCLAMVGNPQDAQDALQNTMIKVLRSLPGEQRAIQLKPWLYRIARNESVETLRKRRQSAELEPQQAAVAGVSETAETRERLRTLLADLEQLPDRQRAALVMRELSGLGFEQIGAAFGTSAAVARQTLYEARLSLGQLEAGREMRCAEVTRELSDADGRVTRRREIQAHLRSCARCRAFRDEIDKRHEDLAVLAPLPLAASAAVLQGALAEAGASGAGAAGAASVGGALSAGAGKAAGVSLVAKSVVTVAVVAVVGVSAADRSGVVDVPLGKGEDVRLESESGSDEPPAAGPEASPAAMPTDAEATGGKAREEPPGNSSPGEEFGGINGGEEGASTAARDPDPSSSQRGLDPPGGGHGRSAAQRHGPPDQLPAASTKGQQNAAAHKSGNGTSPPGQNAASEGDRGNSATAGPPTSKPSQAQGPATPPVLAPELPPEAEAGTERGPAEPPSGPER